MESEGFTILSSRNRSSLLWKPCAPSSPVWNRDNKFLKEHKCRHWEYGHSRNGTWSAWKPQGLMRTMISRFRDSIIKGWGKPCWLVRSLSRRRSKPPSLGWRSLSMICYGSSKSINSNSNQRNQLEITESTRFKSLKWKTSSSKWDFGL